MDGEFSLKIDDFGDEDDVDIAAYLASIAENRPPANRDGK